METLVEQRSQARTSLTWPVSIWSPQANRFFNAKTSNISKTGVYVEVPITTPLRKGQVVEMNFPRSDELAKHKGSYARIKLGKVVRIDRANMLNNARIGVAVQFK